MSLHVLRSTRPLGAAVLRRPEEERRPLLAARLAEADVGDDAHVSLLLSPEVTLRRPVRAGAVVELMPSVPVPEVRLYASHADIIVVWWG